MFDAAKTRGAHTHHGGIKQLQLFERRREWRGVTCDKLNVGIRDVKIVFSDIRFSEPKIRFLSIIVF